MAAAACQGDLRQRSVHGSAVRSAPEHRGGQCSNRGVSSGSGRATAARDLLGGLCILRCEVLPPMHDESLERVQSKIAYLERAMAELGDVVFRQHREIQLLEAQIKAVRDRLEAASSDE